MKALPLYIRYAVRSFVRGRSRSLFGAFCVAVGIAAVVALGLVAGNFRDSITGDARALNRGDVSVSPPGLGFTLRQTGIFRQMKAAGQIEDYTVRLQDDTALRNPTRNDSSTVGSIVGVDRRVFPFYDTIKADQPAGVPLGRLIAGPDDAVVSHDTLDTLGLRVGDRVTVNSRRGFTRIYTITGVVPDSAVNPFFGAGFWDDFAVVNSASVVSFFRGLDVGATTVYIKTRDAADAAAVKRSLERRLGGLATIKTADDVAREQRNSADGFDKFFRIMGLVAVVIGGIGIINTMLVAARRRRREISVLKSLGMKGRQVVAVFVLESLILGMVGSVLGILSGIGVSALVNRVTENLSGNPIPWSLQGEPIAAGLLVGIVGTVLFAYLPVVRASRARPVAALRDGVDGPARTQRFRRLLHSMRHPLRAIGIGLQRAPLGIVHLPRRQGLRTVLVVLSLATVAGWLAVLYTGLATGFRAALLGAAAGLGVLIAAGFLTQVFVSLVWLMSKLPSLGRLSLRMALRSMGTQKRRLASTMLALCIGMLAVGSIAILAQNMRAFFSQSMGQQLGLNVAVQTVQDPVAIARVKREVARLPGIKRRDFGAVANGAQLLSVDGKDATATLQSLRATRRITPDELSTIASDMQGVEGRDLRVARYHWTTVHGRNLDARDVGTDHMVVIADLQHLGVRVGSHLVFRDGGRAVSFTVVGIADSNSPTMFGSNQVDLRSMQRLGLTTRSSSHFSVAYLDIEPGMLRADLRTLRQHLRGDLVLDLSNFTVLINKTIDKLALFPEIIGALALFAGVIIIANTVALAMLERRREIGVMKAVGARRRTILQFLLVENAIVGFLGAAVGVGLAMVATAIADTQLLKISASFDLLTVLGLIVLGVILAMGASLLTALPASSEKPMSVLRYE